MTMNVLLPGATVSGDVLRAYQLGRLGHNTLLRAGASVLLDRLSGLWILCARSLASLGVALGAGAALLRRFALALRSGGGRRAQLPADAGGSGADLHHGGGAARL